MPRDNSIPGNPREWLARAKGSLALAQQQKVDEAFWEDQCFLAQQAAEKALKAVYQSRGLPFRYTHDLEELGKGLEDGGIEIPSEVKEAIVLTRYAVETRYPGTVEPITEEEYLEAISLAEGVVAWAEKILDQA
jgi:HEPN domain-containing protein